jgi:hypothetical protein
LKKPPSDFRREAIPKPIVKDIYLHKALPRLSQGGSIVICKKKEKAEEYAVSHYLLFRFKYLNNL